MGYGSIIPDAEDAESHPSTKALGEKVGSYVEQYVEAMEKVTKSTLPCFMLCMEFCGSISLCCLPCMTPGF